MTALKATCFMLSLRHFGICFPEAIFQFCVGFLVSVASLNKRNMSTSSEKVRPKGDLLSLLPKALDLGREWIWQGWVMKCKDLGQGCANRKRGAAAKAERRGEPAAPSVMLS